MGTSNALEQQSHDEGIEQRWQTLQERCIAITGKTLLDLDAAETLRVVNLFSADDRAFALSHLEHFSTPEQREDESPAPKKARSRKSQPREERMTLAEAFAINDEDKDDERAIRAAGLLLEWAAFENRTVDGFLALGISRTLSLAADRVARTQRRVELERQASAARRFDEEE